MCFLRYVETTANTSDVVNSSKIVRNYYPFEYLNTLYYVT